MSTNESGPEGKSSEDATYRWVRDELTQKCTLLQPEPETDLSEGSDTSSMGDYVLQDVLTGSDPEPGDVRRTPLRWPIRSLLRDKEVMDRTYKITPPRMPGFFEIKPCSAKTTSDIDPRASSKPQPPKPSI